MDPMLDPTILTPSFLDGCVLEICSLDPVLATRVRVPPVGIPSSGSPFETIVVLFLTAIVVSVGWAILRGVFCALGALLEGLAELLGGLFSVAGGVLALPFVFVGFVLKLTWKPVLATAGAVGCGYGLIHTVSWITG